VPLDKNTRPPIEQIKSEWTKCANSPIYFLSEYGYIRTEEKGIVKFDLFDYQKEILDYLRNDSIKNIAVLKSRQLGLSTIVAGFVAWSLIFRKDRHIFNMATKLEIAQVILEMVRTFIEECPKWLNFWVIKKNNTRTIALSNGSWVRAMPTSKKDTGRAEAASLFVIDEAALIDNLDEIYTALFPSLSCVGGDTYIMTDGGIKQIKDLCIGKTNGFFEIENIKTIGRNGCENISHGFVSQISDTLKFTVKYGFKLETTLNHPIMKLTEFGGRMISADSLMTGDYVGMKIGGNLWGNNDYIDHPGITHIDGQLAYMLGGYTAEGHIDKPQKCGGVAITNTNEQFRNVYLSNTIIKQFHVVASRPKDRIICYSKELVNLFKECGIKPGIRAWEKEVPNKIFECSEKIIGQYLSALFDGDGSVSKYDITLVSTSLNLLGQVQQLLLNMGIVSSLSKRENVDKTLAREQNRIAPHGKSMKTLHQGWNLTISSEFFKMFANKIDFRILYKKNKLKCYIKQNKNRNDSNSYIPLKFIAPLIKSLYQKCNKETKQYFRICGCRLDCILYNANKRIIHVGYPWLNSFCRILDEEGIFDGDSNVLRELLNEKLLWVPIESIEKSKNVTYDLTVPGTHTFLQNGIVGGNTGGRLIVLSTPKGGSGKFADIVINGSRLVDGQIQKGTNEFLVFEYPWSRRYSQEWFDKMKVGKSPKEISQEYECKLLESGATFIDADILQRIRSEFETPIEYRYDNKMWIWEFPSPGKQFICSCDVARGDSSDHSTFQIIDIETLTVVAEYKHKIKTDEFAKVLCDVGRMYNNALVVPERNAYGSAVMQDMLKLEYENLYFVFNGMYISRWDLSSFPKAQAGHTTSGTTRPVMMQRLEEFLRLGKIKVRSKRLYDEFTTFSWKGDKPCAPRNKSDDLVLALAIGIYVYEQIYGDGTNLSKFRNINNGEPVGFMRIRETLDQVMQPQHQANVQNEMENFMSMMIRRG